jgi:hypothetical protein
MRTFNNRQMSAAFKKLGFRKSDLQLTRMGISYKHPWSKALFTFAKAENGGIACSAPGEDKMWSFPIGLTQEKFEAFEQAGIRFPLVEGSNADQIGIREVLLCIARGFGEMLEEEVECDECGEVEYRAHMVQGPNGLLIHEDCVEEVADWNEHPDAFTKRMLERRAQQQQQESEV